jgi:hypothetical protein
MGVEKGFGLDLVNQLGRTLLPSAEAAENEPRRLLELCFRSGVPMMIFATGKEFSQLSAPTYSNFSYAGNEIFKAPSRTNLYFNSDSQSLLKHASNIAITQGVENQGGHSSLFNFREGGLTKGKITPIVELADNNTTAAVLHGVRFPGDARNIRGSRRDLIALNSVSGFVSLFTNPRLAFTGGELETVLAASRKLSRRQALLLEEKLSGAMDQVQMHDKSLQMFTSDYSRLLDISSMPSGLQPTGSYQETRRAIALSLKGFATNLINSSMVTIETGDWHGFVTDKQNASIIRDFSEILDATISYLKATPEPSAPGKTLWDTTTIVAGSEFTRGISRFGSDNSDGDTQGAMLIGKNVVGNYYGGFSLMGGGNGTAHGFDTVSGATVSGSTNSVEGLYQTIRRVAGLRLLTTEHEKVFKCMVG